MATYTAVTTKTLRARSSYRADLAVMLRDGGNAIWPTTVLNMCLDEALGLVQVYFPPVRTAIIAADTTLQYDLPADCVAVQAVELANESLDGNQDPPLFTPVRFATRRLYRLVGDTGTEDLATLKLVLAAIPPADLTLFVTYQAAKQVWGSWSTIGSGVDSATTTDLNPCSLGVGLDLRLFWAEARVAAYRFGTQLIPTDGGRDFGRGLELALAERDDLLDRLRRPGEIGIVSSVFG